MAYDGSPSGKLRRCEKEPEKESKTMNIRKSVKEDLPEIFRLYETARSFMKKNGNPSQWGDTYPEEETVKKDVELGQSYVCEEDGKVVGTFVFFIGREPDYDVIENGAWRLEQLSYGVVHRVASSGEVKGVTSAVFSWCHRQCSYLRIDTHTDNKPMQGALKKFGFQQCGTIYLKRGEARIGFDCL